MREIELMKRGIWDLGILSWGFGISDRLMACTADSQITAVDIVQVFTASFFFACWLFLKPTRKEG